MLQKEVVDRIASPPGGKTYGRLSVMLQAHLVAESLFEVPPDAFEPPPAVTSAVLRLYSLPADVDRPVAFPFLSSPPPNLLSVTFPSYPFLSC